MTVGLSVLLKYVTIRIPPLMSQTRVVDVTGPFSVEPTRRNGSEPVVIPANGVLHLCHNRPIIRQAVGDGCCCLVPGDNGTGTRPVPVMFITAEPGLNV